MFKIFKSIILIIWLMDIANFPCMEILDTIYPMNFWFWTLFWILVPDSEVNVNLVRKISSNGE
jgi:hypothetical protein